MRKLFLSALSILFLLNFTYSQITPFPEFKSTVQSSVYKIESANNLIGTQCIEWRSGVASYARFYVNDKTEVIITCAEAGGNWDLSSVKPVDYNIEGNRLRISFGESNKIMIQTASKEVLYLFAESVEEKALIPDNKKVFSILDFGVKPGTEKILSFDIQNAIDVVASKGGGTLLFPAGIYKTGTISIKSKVFLYLAAGARIQASANKTDYPQDFGKTGSGSEMIYTRLILFDHVTNAGIRGLGEIDGGRHTEKIKESMSGILPNLIRIRNCDNISIEGVLLRRAFGWNTHVLFSENIEISNLKSICSGSDGMDIDNSKKVKVSDILISSHDDSFVLKSTTNRYGSPQNVTDIILNDAVLFTVKSALKIGTETNAKKMSDITFENITFAGSRGALVMYIRDGATISDISYKNMTIKNSKHSIEWIIKNRNGKSKIQNITLNNIVSKEINNVILEGLDKSHLIKNVSINNFKMNGKLLNNFDGIPGNRNRFVENISVDF